MTVSIGISAYPHNEITTYNDLAKLADHLLLKAKETGKNRIVTHDTLFLKP
jgi:PleD family two-component response regulator